MRLERRLPLVGLFALAAAAGAAGPYARSMAPYYVAVARTMAAGRPWEISAISVGADARGAGTVIRLTGTVRRARADAAPAAVVVGKLHAGAALQLPLIYWTVVLSWALGSRPRCVQLIASAVPMLLLLEAGSTVAELLNAFADASRALGSEATGMAAAWAGWVAFLESGGRIALAVAGALFVAGVGLQRRLPSRMRPDPTGG